MGKFYVNFSVKSTDPKTIADRLQMEGRTAIVSPVQSGYVMVYEEETDGQALAAIVQVGGLLSSIAPVFAVLNHDDRILRYWLFNHCAIVDAYDSRPDYFKKFFSDLNEEDDDELKEFSITEISQPNQLKTCLQSKLDLSKFKKLARNKYPSEQQRHQAFVAELGLPDWSVGVGYYDINKLKKEIANNKAIDLKGQEFIHIHG